MNPWQWVACWDQESVGMSGLHLLCFPHQVAVLQERWGLYENFVHWLAGSV
jgi:hypothetical protein